MDNLKILKDILSEYNLTEYGILNYNIINNFLECRNITRIPKNTKSVIVIAFPYLIKDDRKSNLCKYARVLDYHTIVNDYLKIISSKLKHYFPDNEFEGFSDVSAFDEHFCAIMSGVGFNGRNHLVINDKYGTYFVIGEIATDLYLKESMPDLRQCLNCKLCEKHCPSKALNKDKDDFSKCLSEITQRKGELSQDEINLIYKNGLVWGCDVCQDVCPHNKNAQTTHLMEFLNSYEPNLTYENLPKLKKERAFGYRGRNLLIRNLDIFTDKPSSD